MKDSLTLVNAVENCTIIHGPKMNDYYENRIKKLSEIFFFNEKIIDKVNSSKD